MSRNGAFLAQAKMTFLATLPIGFSAGRRGQPWNGGFVFREKAVAAVLTK